MMWSSSLRTISLIWACGMLGLSLAILSASSASLALSRRSVSSSSCLISPSTPTLRRCRSWWLHTMPLAFSMNSGELRACPEMSVTEEALSPEIKSLT